MGGEHENRIGAKGRHVDLAASSAAETKSGEDQRDAPLNAMRRRAERRQTSALIALWGEVERRSGDDQRASPGGNDIEHD